MDHTPAFEVLRATIIDALRTARTATDETRTTARRRAAEALVDIREYFTTPKGDPDWSGRTGAFRDFVHEVYAEAGYPRDEMASAQAAIRYHTNNYIRRRVPHEELEDAGFTGHTDALERARTRRAARSETLAILTGGPLLDANAMLMAAQTARAVLARIPADALGGLTPAKRRAVSEALDAVVEERERLRSAVGSR
jgi:hypothetical protein